MEQRVSSKEPLLEAMKNILPRYHTVRVALLENYGAAKIITIAALHQSLRDWMEVLKLAMRCYSIQPEPRRSWFAIWARVAPLYETCPGLAAVVERHLQATQLRMAQDLDAVITFTVNLEAELAGILQDVSTHGGQTSGSNRKQQASAHSAGVLPPGAKEDAKRATPSDAKQCPHWGTKPGCKFGAQCRNVHPFEKPGSGVCYVCGSTEHTAQACARPRKGPAKRGSAGGSGGGSGGGRPDQGGSRGRTPSRGSGKGNKDVRSGSKGSSKGSNGSRGGGGKTSNGSR
eukprot:2058584-Amphidinium_carterae.1